MPEPNELQASSGELAQPPKKLDKRTFGVVLGLFKPIQNSADRDTDMDKIPEQSQMIFTYP